MSVNSKAENSWNVQWQNLEQNNWHHRNHGAVSIKRCCLTGIGIPTLKIRRSHDRLIFNMGISTPGKDGLYTETGPRGHLNIKMPMPCQNRNSHRKDKTASCLAFFVMGIPYLDNMALILNRIWEINRRSKPEITDHTAVSTQCDRW